MFGQFQRVLITEAIDESKLVTLSGNTRPEARRGENDRGLVPDSTPVEHMFLQLRETYRLGLFSSLWRTAMLLGIAGTAFLLFVVFILVMSLR